MRKDLRTNWLGWLLATLLWALVVWTSWHIATSAGLTMVFVYLFVAGIRLALAERD